MKKINVAKVDHMCHGQGCRVLLGMGNLPPLIIGILIMGPYKPLRTWVDEFIPYCMEIIGVDRPWHISDPVMHLLNFE